jgi:hypothetical protein
VTARIDSVIVHGVTQPTASRSNSLSSSASTTRSASLSGHAPRKQHVARAFTAVYLSPPRSPACKLFNILVIVCDKGEREHQKVLKTLLGKIHIYSLPLHSYHRHQKKIQSLHIHSRLRTNFASQDVHTSTHSPAATRLSSPFQPGCHGKAAI